MWVFLLVYLSIRLKSIKQANLWSGIESTSQSSASFWFRNSSTKDLSHFAAEAIAFNRQLSQHDEQQEDAGVIFCSMRLSPPSNSRLARRRAQTSALRSGDLAPACDDLTAWYTCMNSLFFTFLVFWLQPWPAFLKLFFYFNLFLFFHRGSLVGLDRLLVLKLFTMPQILIT